MDRPRILFHVQHLLGVGHRNRAHLIAAACRDAGMDIALTAAPDEALPDGVRSVRLPSIRAADATFSALVDGEGRPVSDDLWATRRDRLMTFAAEFRPDVLLIEGYPFARRKLKPEIEPLAEACRERGAAVAASVRDILIAKPDPARNEAAVKRASVLHDRILVHGDPAFVRLEESYPSVERLADRLLYTGYVAPRVDERRADEPGPVVVSVGGGAVGAALLEAALAVRGEGVLKDRPWRLLGGPNLPEEDHARLAAEAASLDGVTLEPALSGDEFRRLLGQASLSISQAGYNTVVDLWRTGPRRILIPFSAGGRETEQPFRAARMAERGMAHVVSEEELSPAKLREAIREAMTAPPPPAVSVDLEGARKTADALASLAVSRGVR